MVILFFIAKFSRIGLRSVETFLCNAYVLEAVLSCFWGVSLRDFNNLA